MNGSLPFKTAVRTSLSDHFESGIATTGVVIAIVATLALLMQRGQSIVLALVLWNQGLIFWALRRHIRLGREHLVVKLRIMLQDRVNNQLTVLVGLTDLHAKSPPTDDQDDVEIALTAARAVSREIETLSVASLRSWEQQYSRHLPTSLN